MNIYSLPSILAFTVNISIAFIIFLDNPRSKINRWFAAFVMVFVLWNLSEILILTTSKYSEALFGAQILYRVIFLLPSFFVAIAYNFPIPTARIAGKVYFYFLLFFVPIVFLVLSFPNFKIGIVHLQNERIGYFYKLSYTNELLFNLQLIVIVLYLIWGTTVLIRKIPKLRTIKQKNQTFFLVIGFIVIIVYFLLINIFRFYLNSVFSAYFLNTICALAVNIFFLYILLHFKTFNARNILRSGITYSIIYTFILSVYFIVVNILSQTINKVFRVNSFIISAFIILLLVSLIKPLETKIQKLLDNVFLKDRAKYMHKFSQLNIELQKYLTQKELLTKVINFIKNNFLVREITLYLKDEDKNYYNLKNRNYIINSNLVDKIKDFFLSNRRAVELYEFDLEKIVPAFLNMLKKEKIEIILPLIFNDEILAFLFLSQKKYKSKFTEDELGRLTILANEIVIAYNRNKIFEDLQLRKVEEFRLEKLAAIGQMTAGIAHEVRNPLNTISVSAQTIKKGGLKTDENNELLEFIVQEVERLDNLLKDFLKLSRDLEVKFEVVEVKTLFSKIMTAIEIQNKNNIKITCECEKSIKFKTDPSLLYQVLLNLAFNSIDAIVERCKTDENFNSSLGMINFFSHNINSKIIIEIQDNGIGIPKERLNYIFNPFFTTKEEGTGLGLSIAHHFVTSLRGTIDVNSLANRTEFIISFPKNIEV